MGVDRGGVGDGADGGAGAFSGDGGTIWLFLASGTAAIWPT